MAKDEASDLAWPKELSMSNLKALIYDNRTLSVLDQLLVSWYSKTLNQ